MTTLFYHPLSEYRLSRRPTTFVAIKPIADCTAASSSLSISFACMFNARALFCGANQFYSGKTIQSFLIAWDKFIVKFGNYMSLVQDNPPWQGSEPLTTAIVGAITQAFFLIRLYKLLGKAWIVYIVIASCSLMGLGGAIWLVRIA